MSVKPALYRYLTDPQDLTGPAVVPFARPRVVAGLTIKNRNDARRWLRDRVGASIYSGRRPMKPSEHSQIYFRTAYQQRLHDLTGAVDGTTELVDAVIICRHTDAPARAEAIADLLCLAVGGWGGGRWSDTFVGECLVDGRVSRTYSPVDGSDEWLHEVAMGLEIIYVDESAAVYPADELRPVISYAQLPGIGTDFRVSALNSIVPEGRTLANVAWVIRDIGPGGTILVQFNGAPSVAVSMLNIGGTYAEPAISRAEYGITGQIHIQLTLTDSSGDVATFGETRNA